MPQSGRRVFWLVLALGYVVLLVFRVATADVSTLVKGLDVVLGTVIVVILVSKSRR